MEKRKKKFPIMQLKFRACLGMLVLKIQPVWYFAYYQTKPSQNRV